MKLSFKKEARPTGLSAVASPNPDTQIKADKKYVGRISGPSSFGYDNWHVWIMIKKEPTIENPAEFKNLRLKGEWESEEKARQWVIEKWNAIQEKFELHQSDRN